MKIVYLGTGASEGIPALFCRCDFCARVRAGEEKTRSRAQIIIDDELSIDFPPDVFYHSVAFGAKLFDVKYLFVTHSHMDHFYAHDFILRGYKYARELAPLTIFANEEVREVFDECTRREMRDDVLSLIRFQTLKAFEPVVFGDWRAVPLKAKHTTQDPFVYLFEKGGKRILHLTDTGALPEEDFDFLKREGKHIDLITFDCTFLCDDVSPSARHMGIQANDKIFKRLLALGLVNESTKKVITHFSHNSVPTALKLQAAEKEFGVIAAYDGMELNI